MDQKIIDYSKFDFANSTIIKPQDGQLEDTKRSMVKKTRVVVDSRYRNLQLYPNPSKYSIDLYEDIQDAISCELVVADVPFTSYIINNNNNQLDFNINNVWRTINVPVGDYTGSSLAVTLQGLLNNYGSFVVNFDSVSDKFTFVCDRMFTFAFKDTDLSIDFNGQNNIAYKKNTIGKHLGFGIDDYTSNSSFVLISPFRKNLSGSNYIVMYVDQFNVNNSISDNLNKSFGLIHKKANDLNVISNNGIIKKTFAQPLAKISKLNISFYDADGQLYDFQNQDHRLEFLFDSHKHTRGYNSYI